MDGLADHADNAARLKANAEALVPELRERAAETAEIRRVSDETIARFRALDLLKGPRPVRYGGYALDFDVIVDLIATLARGCASSAWVYGICADHAMTMGMFSTQAQDEIWANNPEVIVSSGLAPSGTVTRDGDGYRLSGRWQFSSGCDHADWVFVQSVMPADGDDAPEQAYLLVPRADWEIVDTWFVSGLAGTGSKDVVIEDAFVPAHRIEQVAGLNENKPADGAPDPSHLFRLPRISTTPYCLVAPGVGVLDAMIEAFVDRIGARSTRGVRHAQLTTMQLRLAESSAERDAARLLLERATRETTETMKRDGGLSLEHRARNRRDMAFISTLCLRAADRLYSATGASGIFDGNELNRLYHDVRAMAAHHVNSWDISGPIYGRVALGLEPAGML